jgi:hypothetical protein
VQHLTFVESMWFEEIAAGGKPARGDRSMRVDPLGLAADPSSRVPRGLYDQQRDHRRDR